MRCPRNLVFLLAFGVPAVALARKPIVVCTTTIAADIAANLAGPHVEVISLLPPGTDPHLYQPVPQDIELLRRADAIFRNGLHLEGWLDKLAANAETSARMVRLSDGVAPLSDDAHSHDPHAWMDPRNAMVYARNIRDALRDLVPASAAAFEANYQRYRRELLALDAWMAKQFARVPKNELVLITTHDAFGYLARRYGFRVEALMGISTEEDVQLNSYQLVAEVIDATGVRAVFVESTINPKLLNQLAQDRGVVIGGRLFADSIDEPGTAAGTYIGMMRHNTRTIVSGLLEAQAVHSALTRENWLLGALTLALLAAFGAMLWRLQQRPRYMPPAREPRLLCLRDFHVQYGHVEALRLPHLDLFFGRLYAVVGQNGSGKSSLLKSLLGLVDARGQAHLDETPFHPQRDGVAYVPQHDSFDLHYPVTVRDLARFGWQGRWDAVAKARVQEALRRLGLADLAGRHLTELSGGQLQRALLARALVQNAQVYLLDEPFVGVDAASEAHILAVLRELAAAGALVVVVHHDLSTVRQHFDAAVLLNTTLVATGTPTEVLSPANLEAAYGVSFPPERPHPQPATTTQAA